MRKLKPSFDDFEIEPSPQVWMKIESRLDEIPSNRRGWLFFSVAAIAVVSAVLFFTVFYDIDINVKPKQKAGGNTKISDEKQNESVTVSGLSDKALSPLRNELPAAMSSSAMNERKTERVQSNKIPEKKIASAYSTVPALVNPVAKKQNDISQIEKAALLQASDRTDPLVEKMNVIDPFNSEANLLLSTAYLNETATSARHKFSVSRWEVSLGAAYEYNYRIINYASKMSISEKQKQYFKDEKGINSVSYSAVVNYSLSTHYTLVSGISYISAGQERNQSEVTQEETTPAIIKNVYSVNTSTGAVINNSAELDQVYYSSLDSTPVVSFSNPGYNPVAAHSAFATFKFRQQFYFVSIPVLIRYQATERRLTPYIGLGFSVDYLVKEKTVINDKELNSQYLESLNRFLFSGEAQAGIKYRVSRHFSCFAQPSLRYGLNSLNNNQVKWIPYAYGIGAGLNYRF